MLSAEDVERQIAHAMSCDAQWGMKNLLALIARLMLEQLEQQEALQDLYAQKKFTNVRYDKVKEQARKRAKKQRAQNAR